MTVTIALNGRIDSGNAAEVERKILSELEGKDGAAVVLDADELRYISSAGLRVLLRIKKTHPDLTITGVHSDVYEILDMTGFTELMKVERRTASYRSRGARRSGAAQTARSTASTGTTS